MERKKWRRRRGLRKNRRFEKSSAERGCARLRAAAALQSGVTKIREHFPVGLCWAQCRSAGSKTKFLSGCERGSAAWGGGHRSPGHGDRPKLRPNEVAPCRKWNGRPRRASRENENAAPARAALRNFQNTNTRRVADHTNRGKRVRQRRSSEPLVTGYRRGDRGERSRDALRV